MLRRTLRLKIEKALEKKPYIYPEDFEYQEVKPERGDGTRIEIRYLMDNGQFYLAEIGTKIKSDAYDFDIAVRYNPGTITDNQSDNVSGAKGLTESIAQWVSRIQEDLQAAPDIRAVEQLASRMQSVEEQLESYPDDLATNEQVEQLQKFINELEIQLKTEIDSLTISMSEKEKKIADLEKQFVALRLQTEGGKVKHLMRRVITRVYRAAADPDLPKVLQNGKKIFGLLSSSDDPTS